MNEQEQFEAWVNSLNPGWLLDKTKNDGDYAFPRAYAGWQAWQAAIATQQARNEALDDYCEKLRYQTVNQDAVIANLQARIEVLREPLMAARSLAMKNTMAAKVPECGDFGAIAQDLDYVCSQLFPEPPEQEGE